MGFEKNGYLGEELEGMRKRVEKLGEMDNKYQDSMYELAKEEDQKREKTAGKLKRILGDNTSDAAKAFVDEEADSYSTVVLEKIEAEKEKMIDGLTGLRNKRALIEEMSQTLSLMKREKKDCSILMFDLDKFKEINDKYGHLAGDKILKKMAETLRSAIRTSDIAYRFGGEEFTVLLPGATTEEAQMRAEEIRKKIEWELTSFAQKQSINRPITASIGCASASMIPEWEKPQEIIRLAEIEEKMKEFSDQALYFSKNSGRNKVSVYEPGMSGSVEKAV